MKIKVCGMRDPENIREVCELGVGFVGLIFYEKSPRFVDAEVDIPVGTGRVGVFVDSALGEVLHKVKTFDLDHVQLHGGESVDYCLALKDAGVEVIKAFSVDESFDFGLCKKYQDVCDYFLFDAGSGGSGRKFDWKLLEKYDGERDFFLAGGIGPADGALVKGLKHERLFALDLNSGFEQVPGVKDVQKLKKFLQDLQ